MKQYEGELGKPAFIDKIFTFGRLMPGQGVHWPSRNYLFLLIKIVRARVSICFEVQTLNSSVNYLNFRMSRFPGFCQGKNNGLLSSPAVFSLIAFLQIDEVFQVNLAVFQVSICL